MRRRQTCEETEEAAAVAESKNFATDANRTRRSLFGAGVCMNLTVALGSLLLLGTVVFYAETGAGGLLLLGAVELALCCALLRCWQARTQCGPTLERAEPADDNQEQRLALLNHYYLLLHEASLGMLNRMDRPELMQSLLRLLAEVSGIHNSFLFLLDPASNRMVRRFGWGVHSTMAVGVQSYARGEAAVGTVWATGQTLLVGDYRIWNKRDPDAAHARFTSVLAVPVRRGNDEIVGVMGLTCLDEVRDFTPEVVEFLERAAQVVAVSLDNLSLFENLQKSEAMSRAVFEQSCEAMALIDVEKQQLVEVNLRCVQMLEYDSRDELIGLAVQAVAVDSSELADSRWTGGYRSDRPSFAPEIRRLRRKNGAVFEVEQSLAHIFMADRVLLMASFRDVTETRRIQQQLEFELHNAALVQRALLAPDSLGPRVEIRTFYQPHHEVSGDFYGYHWNHTGTVLQGYVIDVMGHGVATALQTAALNVLFHQAMDEQLSLEQTMLLVNRQVQAYFSEGMFAAAICFELDLSKMKLRYISAGINYFLASSRNLHGLVKVPGSLVGVDDDPDFCEHSTPVQPGDVFYFVTDGLMDVMQKNVPTYVHDFNCVIAAMRIAAPPKGGHDDATALCLRICEPVSWPLQFELTRAEEARYLRGRLRTILGQFVGEDSTLVEVVLNEAVNNAIRSAEKSANPLVRIKINVYGSRLLLRIRDSGNGFAVKDMFATLQPDVGSCPAGQRYSEDGRGLGIMQSVSDRLIYNRTGNEVLVVKIIQNSRTLKRINRKKFDQ